MLGFILGYLRTSELLIFSNKSYRLEFDLAHVPDRAWARPGYRLSLVLMREGKTLTKSFYPGPPVDYLRGEARADRAAAYSREGGRHLNRDVSLGRAGL